VAHDLGGDGFGIQACIGQQMFRIWRIKHKIRFVPLRQRVAHQPRTFQHDFAFFAAGLRPFLQGVNQFDAGVLQAGYHEI
jgi:hypothetical protein